MPAKKGEIVTITPEDIILSTDIRNLSEIVQSNKITGARYSFSLMEKRAIWLVAMAINKDIKGEQKLTRDMLGDIYLQFKPNEVLKASDRYETVYKAFRSLSDKKIEINTEYGWEYFGLIERPRHVFIKGDRTNSYFQFRVPKPIVDFFAIQLKDGHATVLEAQVAFTLERTCTQRLYEYARQFKVAGGFRRNLEEFRLAMGLESTVRMSRWSIMKNEFIEPAKKELKTLYDKGECDLYFNYKEEKVGKRVKGVRFKIITRDKKVYENYKIEDFIHYCREWLNIMFDTRNKPKNKEYVKRVISFITLHPDRASELHEKIIRIKANYDLEEQARVMRTIIKNDDFQEEKENKN